MVYTGLAITLAILCGLAVLVAAKLLFRNSWFLGWLRGMFGLFFLAGAAVLAFVALDILTYKQISKEQVIATLSFEKLAEQQFEATLVSNEGWQKTYILSGDQWQLDARILKWKGFVSRWGVPPCYRLDRISGRYYSLDQEREKDRAIYSISQSEYNVDVWQWVNHGKRVLPLLDAIYGSATFVPMADGALFEVSLSATGLLSRPLNDAATSAVGQW